MSVKADSCKGRKISRRQVDDYFKHALDRQSLKNKTIAVTGANGALGRTASLALAEIGATVVLIGRTLSELEKVYDEIVSAGGAEPAIYPMHLDNLVESEYQKLADTLADELGELDGLVINAVYFDKLRPLAHTSVESLQKSLAVNVCSPFLLNKYLSPIMRRDSDCAMIAVMDAQESNRDAFWGSYKISKRGFEELWKILALESANNNFLSYCGFDPGPLNSALRARAYPAVNPAQFPHPHSAGQALATLCVGREIRGEFTDFSLVD